MTFHIITIFPKIFDSYLNESIIKRALKNNLIDIKVHNLRDWTTDKHKTVDDAPFGGGAGMVMKIEPLYKAIKEIEARIRNKESGKKSKKKFPNSKFLIPNSKIVLLSAKGKVWNQQKAKSFSRLDNVILICGRYEGVDERITKFIDAEISIGDYVLTGGEIGALAMIDSIARLLPGALGNADSAKNESHTIPGVLEHPQYTRPEIFKTTPLIKGPACHCDPPDMLRLSKRAGARAGRVRGIKSKSYRVPKILLSGNHKKIEEWRKKHSKRTSTPLIKGD
ncbi:MAG: tRNA (guanosine(37)-N1)-methyltransferase TrmD [Patescibacteria group bacterium]|nr:tRNA (guanosine(37)-N1)-methyltransferase TrmD [Patescibacteria group bacterium]